MKPSDILGPGGPWSRKDTADWLRSIRAAGTHHVYKIKCTDSNCPIHNKHLPPRVTKGELPFVVYECGGYGLCNKKAIENIRIEP